MQPGPLISPRVKVVLALMRTEGETFQPWPKLARRALARAFGGHAGLALFAGEVLRADRARLGFGDAVEVAEVEAQPVKVVFRRQ